MRNVIIQLIVLIHLFSNKPQRHYDIYFPTKHRDDITHTHTHICIYIYIYSENTNWSIRPNSRMELTRICTPKPG